MIRPVEQTGIGRKTSAAEDVVIIDVASAFDLGGVELVDEARLVKLGHSSLEAIAPGGDSLVEGGRGFWLAKTAPAAEEEDEK